MTWLLQAGLLALFQNGAGVSLYLHLFLFSCVFIPVFFSFFLHLLLLPRSAGVEAWLVFHFTSSQLP